MKLIDLTGKRFGRWTVIKRVNNNVNNKQPRWLCACDCGAEREVLGVSIRKGSSQSCGCFFKDRMTAIKTKHGLRGHRLYSIWKNMLNRCNNPKHESYKDYGGRGIKVCEQWHSIEHFYSDLIDSYERHVREKGEIQTSLDRVNVDGNYELSNVKWSTQSEQNANKRINSRNSSGFKGVYLHNKEKSQWRAVIFVNKKKIHLGLFNNVDEAAHARKLAESKYRVRKEESA